MPSQEKGYRTKTRIAFEDGYKTLPDPLAGFAVPINSNTVGGSRAQNSSQTLTGRRDPVEPDEGNLDVTGEVVVPVDAHAFGLWLKAMLAAPASAPVAGVDLGNGAVRDLGSGKVGIPCPGHGLAKGAPVVLAWTTNYNGYYRLEPETTADELVVAAPFVAESVTDAGSCTLSRRVTLDAGGAAEDLGGGLVGLPSSGHGLPVGSQVTVSGTENYDGAHFVVRGTTSNLLAVAGSFADETMDGTETATAPFFDHTFTVRDVAMPSLTVEKAFPTVGAYLRSRGCKVNQCSLTLGGDGELTASLEVKGAAEDKAAEVLDAAAVSHPFARFKNFQAAVAEGGAAVSGRFKEFELTLGFDLDDDTYTIGDEGERGDLGEGVIALSGKLTALFKDTAYLDKALAGTATSLTATLTNGGYRLAFAFQEVKFQRTSPAIEGPKGVKESFTWNAYYSSGAADSSVVVTLRNEIANWEA